MPEIVLQQDYNQMCDIFSAGIVLFNMLTNQRPFRRIFNEKVKENKNKNENENWKHDTKLKYDESYESLIGNKNDFWQK